MGWFSSVLRSVHCERQARAPGVWGICCRLSQSAVFIWKERCAFREVQCYGRLAGPGQDTAPNSPLASYPLPKKRSPAETGHRAQHSPSRARPQSPAAGSGAGGAAGEGGPGRGAGRPPGELGAHSGSGAAAIWAASPRRRGRSRNGGASGDRMEGSARQPGTSDTHSSHRGGLVAVRSFWSLWGCSL